MSTLTPEGTQEALDERRKAFGVVHVERVARFPEACHVKGRIESAHLFRHVR